MLVDKSDKRVEIMEGEYKGHLGVIRRMGSGEKALMVLDKSCTDFQGQVKVIDILEFDESNKCIKRNIH